MCLALKFQHDHLHNGLYRIQYDGLDQRLCDWAKWLKFLVLVRVTCELFVLADVSSSEFEVQIQVVQNRRRRATDGDSTTYQDENG